MASSLSEAVWRRSGAGGPARSSLSSLVEKLLTDYLPRARIPEARAQGEEVMSDHPAKKRKARRKGLPPPQVELEFRNTDQAIARTADRIKGEIEKLFSRLPLKYVARHYVLERLMDELITDNPELLDWLNGHKESKGDISMRLAKSLADWRDSQVHER